MCRPGLETSSVNFLRPNSPTSLVICNTKSKMKLNYSTRSNCVKGSLKIIK